MKVDTWSEVICPWCGLGNHRVTTAIARFEHADEVELVHHSFPLSSSFPEGSTFPVREALLRRHGIGGSQAETSTRRIEKLAASEGLTPYQGQVRDDADRARRLGATGAPFIVVDDRYGVPGAQDSDSLLELLRTVWNDSPPHRPRRRRSGLRTGRLRRPQRA